MLGWKGQELSKAAKEILVKSVLEATPTYIMSCFHLTKEMCGNLSSIPSNFWWGADDGERKVHWIAWENKMCTSKKEGGMGFRDFEAFNQALLAKQTWRLVKFPNSVCARVLKARYYKEHSIMSATCPTGGSYTFRSIIHGRNLLRHGMIWRIGNRTNVNIFHDQWIPRKGSMTPLGRVSVPGVQKVVDLLAPDGISWNKVRLAQMFPRSEADEIELIVVGGSSVPDFLAWNFTRSGVYSVRSGYHLAMDLKRLKKGRPGSSYTVGDHKAWMSPWDTNAPPKARIHTWRMIKNGPTVGAELSRRNIKQGIKCVVCGRNETIHHRFWSCPHSKLVWKLFALRKG